MLERLLKSTWPALTLFLTPLTVPFLLHILIRLLLNSISLLALAYKSRSSGSQPFSSTAASTTKPFRWRLVSLVGREPPCCSASGLLVESDSTESSTESSTKPHQALSSLNTSAKTRPLLADATLNLTVFPAFSFSCFSFGLSIEIQECLTCFTSHSEKPDALSQCCAIIKQ